MKNKRLFGKICYLQRQMCRQNNKLLSDYGVTPVQMHALIFILKNEKTNTCVCQKDVEKEVNLRPSSVSTLITNLERDGFIMRSISESDARAKYITLTDKGREVCIKDKQFMEKCDEAINCCLNEDEQDVLDGLLTKLVNSISVENGDI